VNITLVMWLAFALDEPGLRWGIKILQSGEVCLQRSKLPECAVAMRTEMAGTATATITNFCIYFRE
jgi:hypothetical protein